MSLDQAVTAPYVVVLGIAQDGGYPQAGCRRSCCERARSVPENRRHAACLAVVDPATGRRWLVDATPDFSAQLAALDAVAPTHDRAPGLSGVFLTHGHIGHYTGLVHLGSEVMGADSVPIHAMPLMGELLRLNLPWSDLVAQHRIVLHETLDGVPVELSAGLRVTPLLVPHRDEHTETVGYIIRGRDRAVLYVPDTDDWDKWTVSLESWLELVDVAYLDGTFFDLTELPGRDAAEIPHPTVMQTMHKLAHLPFELRNRVRFLHLNHTNPCLDPDSLAAHEVCDNGYGLASEGERVSL